MRQAATQPARQLHSVALRYGGVALRYGGSPTTRGAAVRAVRGRRRLSGSASPSKRPTDPSTPRRSDSRLGRIEAVLFLAREPLPSRKLARLAGLADATQARTLIRRLNGLYDAAGRAFRADEVAGGYQLLTRPQFAPWLRRHSGGGVEVRLSQPAMETLAVVAYRQPVLRSEIEAVRGVQCGEVLRQLMERSMVRMTGRADELGRPILYGTTRRFLQVFGLRHLDELPRAAVLRRQSDETYNNPESPTAGQKEPDAMTAFTMPPHAELDDEIRREPRAAAGGPDAAQSGDSFTELADDLLGAADEPDEEDDLEDDDEDDDEDEEEDEDEDDDDLEEEEWEEVEDEDDDDEEEDDEDEDDDDWDEDEDEDWEEDEEDEWEDDDEEEEEEEAEEAGEE